jgi:hypothetical protein
MSNERTEQLIVELAADLSAVQRLPAVRERLATWLTVTAAIAAAAVFALGARADLAVAITRPGVFGPLLFALTVAVAAAAEALRLSVPGLDDSRWIRWLPIGGLLSWVAVVIFVAGKAPVPGLSDEIVHFVCVLRVVAIAAIPVAVLTRSVRQGFSLDPGWSAALTVLAGGAAAAAAAQLVCPIDDSTHVLMSHVAPVIAATLLSVAVSRAAR